MYKITVRRMTSIYSLIWMTTTFKRILTKSQAIFKLPRCSTVDKELWRGDEIMRYTNLVICKIVIASLQHSSLDYSTNIACIIPLLTLCWLYNVIDTSSEVRILLYIYEYIPLTMSYNWIDKAIVSDLRETMQVI